MARLGPPSSRHLRDCAESLRREVKYARDEISTVEVAAISTVTAMIDRLLVERQRRSDVAYRAYPGRPT